MNLIVFQKQPCNCCSCKYKDICKYNNGKSYVITQLYLDLQVGIYERSQPSHDLSSSLNQTRGMLYNIKGIAAVLVWTLLTNYIQISKRPYASFINQLYLVKYQIEVIMQALLNNYI